MIKRAFEFYKRHHQVRWALVDQTMVSGVNFLTGIMLARFLGIEEFGRFTLAWLAVLFINAITHTLVKAPMISIGPKQDEEDVPAYYGAVMIQQLIFAATAFVLLFLGVSLTGSVFPDWDIQHLALPLASVVMAFQLQDFLRRYFFTRGRPVLAFIMDAVRYIGQLTVLAWLFIFLGASMDTAKVLWIISGLAITATFVSLLFIERLQLNRAVFHATAVRHWHFAKWLSGSAMIRWGKENLLVIVSGGVLGVSAVGALQAAKSIMGVAHILFLGLENVVPAKASSILKKHGQGVMAGYFKKVGIAGGILTASFALVAAAAPEFWLNLLFGEEYRGYGYLLQWYGGLYVLAFFSTILNLALRTIEVTRPIFLANVLAATLSILLAYPLISNLGLTGVVVGVLAMHLTAIVTLSFYLSRELKSRSG